MGSGDNEGNARGRPDGEAGVEEVFPLFMGDRLNGPLLPEMYLQRWGIMH